MKTKTNMVKLRSYQQELLEKVLSISPEINPLIQADTGSGKTAIIARIVKEKRSALVIAHRNILVKQLSVALAKEGVVHQVIGSEQVRRLCVLEHRKTLQKEFINTTSSYYVCSIDTLLSRHRRGLLNLEDVQCIIFDEAHHVVSDNKWGKMAEIFPSAQLIGFTATPKRFDQKSLSKSGDGLFDCLLQSEDLKKDSVKSLIKQGYLSDFKAYCSKQIDDYSGVKISRGDYDPIDLAAKMRGRFFELSGDAIEHYKRLSDGKQAFCFCVSISFAEEMAKRFKAAGYTAACISSRMSQKEVMRIFELFKMRQIQVLTHVDMVGEGVDVPAIETLIMLRPTASFSNYRQWVGRALRPDPDKDHAIILDHVGNVLRHGLPDKHVEWSLDSDHAQRKNNLIPCYNCGFVLEAWSRSCSECGAEIKSKHATNPAYCSFVSHELVLIKRERLAKEDLLSKQIIWPSVNQETNAIDIAVQRIKEWFIEQLTHNASYYELNLFLRSQVASQQRFWIKNFTLADVSTKNKKKCLALFLEWKKHDSSRSC